MGAESLGSSVIEAAGAGVLAVGEAAKREPHEAWKTMRVVGVVAVVALFVWASWLAPWARSEPPSSPSLPGSAAPAPPLSKQDLQDALAPIHDDIRELRGRVDLIYARLPK